MGIEYVNRKGDRYYLLQGKTKTGKPKYYVARKISGEPVEEMPEGYELYEHPEQGLVHVRKIRPTNILPSERERLADLTRELANTEFFVVDIQEDSLIVHAPGDNPSGRARLLNALFGGSPTDEESNLSWIAANAVYLPMFCFSLEDGEDRRFSVERWCFRGAIDGWYPLSSGKSLEQQARKYLPHLGKESFYELM